MLKHLSARAPRTARPSGPMTVSIILPNYNHARYLATNLEGFIAQTYPHWRLHVVDDGSTDGSVAIIRDFAAREPRIRPIYFPQNRGAMKAIEEALAHADGELLYGSASDDFVCNPRFFALAVKALSGSDAAGFFGRASVVDSETLQEKWVMGSSPNTGFVSPRHALIAFLHSRLFVPGISSVWRRDRIEQCGGYDSALGPQSDYYLNHALPALAGVIFSNEVVATCRVVAGSYSAAVSDEDFFRRHALVERKIRALPLPYDVRAEWFTTWRENLINARLAVTRQSDFVRAVRAQLGNIQPWEVASFPKRFSDCTAPLLKDCDLIESELGERLAEARRIFSEVATARAA